jgi:hypothetical protein
MNAADWLLLWMLRVIPDPKGLATAGRSSAGPKIQDATSERATPCSETGHNLVHLDVLCLGNG